jgi:hypothetical protein
MKLIVVALVLWPATLLAQEANSGLELNGTLTGETAYSRDLTADPRDGAPLIGGMRAVLYPTFKFDDNWSVSGAVALQTRPFYSGEFQTQGYGLKTDILQLHLTYSRFSKNRSLVVRVGQLSSAFGSFLLRYDDAVNPLVQMPLSYGYYGAGVTTLGLAGAQVDATMGKVDVRAQFVNSSPANPRGLTQGDQYGNWAGGAGYTLAQGFRVGISAYRGPHLDRQFPYYFPGEAELRDLPVSAYGLDVQWGRGPWNVYGELQKFQFTYRAIPTFNENTGYGELRRVLHPRWYVAARASYMQANAAPALHVLETAVGFRPNRYQLIKVSYEVQQGPSVHGSLDNVFAVQFVTVLRTISIARD